MAKHITTIFFCPAVSNFSFHRKESPKENTHTVNVDIVPARTTSVALIFFRARSFFFYSDGIRLFSDGIDHPTESAENVFFFFRRILCAFRWNRSETRSFLQEKNPTEWSNSNGISIIIRRICHSCSFFHRIGTPIPTKNKITTEKSFRWNITTEKMNGPLFFIVHTVQNTTHEMSCTGFPH